jgi:four helix bundle protein
MRNYEDLQVGQKAHKLTLEIYKNTRCFPNEEWFGLTSQTRRSYSSIGPNIAAG